MLEKWITELQAIAQNGLTYSQDEFDRERFFRLLEIAAELTEIEFNEPDIKRAFLGESESGYATPKLDVRAFILRHNKVLMVKERSDGKWTLPGGWIDVNESPSLAAERETLEESGFQVKATRLLALWDKLKHDHPQQWPHTYKCIFLCELVGGSATINKEVSAIDFFTIDDLPELSINRITHNQLQRLYELAKNSKLTDFD